MRGLGEIASNPVRLNTQIMNSQEETEQTKNDIYSELREMAHFFGGWDELREIVKILEEEDKIASSERYFSRDI